MKPILLVLLLLVTGLASARDALDRLFGLGNPDVFTVASEMLERDFHVYVRLPRGYADTECRYPAVYLLDGGILFPMLAPFHFMMELDGIAPEAVIVGISYGGLGFENGNLRSTDYTAPADEPEYYGGASRYQQFLREELIPMIGARYRTDPDRRVLVGQSLGGQFALYSALTDPGLFWGRVAVNPALHRNVDFFIDLEAERARDASQLFVATGSEEQERFAVPARQWLDAWRSREDQPLELRVETLEGQHHASAAPSAGPGRRLRRRVSRPARRSRLRPATDFCLESKKVDFSFETTDTILALSGTERTPT